MSQNIEFRQIERWDLEQLRNWRNEERVRKNCREYRLLNMVNQENWFNKISNSKTDEMYLIVETNKLWELQPIPYKRLGVCGLTNINWKDRSAEFSYYSGLTDAGHNATIIKEVFKFLKKKVFEEYNLNRFWGEVYSCNEVALKINLHFGMKEEGRLRQSYFWDGKYWDSIIVGMLAEEYFAKE